MVARTILLAVLAAAPAAVARDGARKVPPELAEVLNDARAALNQGRPDRAISLLTAWSGADHAIRRLILGHARAQTGDLAGAEADYRAALRLEPDLASAGLGLAHVLVRREEWAAAAESFGRHADVSACEADTLLLYARTARELRDARLARMLIATGIRRFPRDLRFRRLDLAAAMDRADHAAAAEALDMLLAREPTDPELWQYRAAVLQAAGNAEGARAALMAAVLCQPGNLARHKALLRSLVVAGDASAVLARGKALLAGPMRDAAAADLELLELLIRAADQARDDELLDKLLARVAPGDRTEAMHAIEARSALRRGRTPDARAALARLIRAGEADAGAYLWAGRLAEKAGDLAEAETLYRQARRLEGASAELATLYLARLQHRRGRSEGAARLLRAHLDAHPADAAARALLELVEPGSRGPR